MLSLTELWLPIMVSAAFVFVVSSILHMVIPIHKGDFKKLPSEDKLLAAMREAGVGRGAYMFPCPDCMKDMGSPEMLEKYKNGPVGSMIVIPNGPPAMGKSLVLWFLYTILVGIFVAYVVNLSLGPGADFMAVFRMAGTIGVLAYATAAIPDSIWKGQAWGITAKFIFDGVVYGLVTGATFGWLWPAGA